MNELTPKEVQILEVVYDAFGGACLERQLLAFSDVSHDDIDELAKKNFLKRYGWRACVFSLSVMPFTNG